MSLNQEAFSVLCYFSYWSYNFRIWDLVDSKSDCKEKSDILQSPLSLANIFSVNWETTLNILNNLKIIKNNIEVHRRAASESKYVLGKVLAFQHFLEHLSKGSCKIGVKQVILCAQCSCRVGKLIMIKKKLVYQQCIICWFKCFDSINSGGEVWGWVLSARDD